MKAQPWRERRAEYLREKGAREMVVVSGGRESVVVVQIPIDTQVSTSVQLWRDEETAH